MSRLDGEGKGKKTYYRSCLGQRGRERGNGMGIHDAVIPSRAPASRRRTLCSG